MKIGDMVRVYPHGKPDEAATARVALDSVTKKVLVLWFDERPPFARGSEGGMVLWRYGVGPWLEVADGGHYEVEEVEQC